MSDETNKLADENLDDSPVADETSVAEDEQEASVEVADAEVVETEVAEETSEEEASEKESSDSEEDEAESEDDEAESDDEDEDEGEEEEEAGEVEEEAAAEDEEDDENKMDWYILKVQSNREKSITAALRRKIAVEGLEHYFGDVIVPTEKVTEFKNGKKRIVQRKLYPGYIVVHMCINDDTWFAIRETSGIGDFTGSGGKPTPMLPHEVARVVQKEEDEEEEAPKLNISFSLGDRVKVKEGNFESFEGDVSEIDEHSGRITVMINIFGRSTPVELEYWQVEQT